MVLKKFTPINVDMETHAELVKRKEAGKGSLTKQVHVLVLGEITTPTNKEDEIVVPPKVISVEEKKEAV